MFDCKELKCTSHFVPEVLEFKYAKLPFMPSTVRVPAMVNTGLVPLPEDWNRNSFPAVVIDTL